MENQVLKFITISGNIGKLMWLLYFDFAQDRKITSFESKSGGLDMCGYVANARCIEVVDIVWDDILNTMGGADVDASTLKASEHDAPADLTHFDDDNSLDGFSASQVYTYVNLFLPDEHLPWMSLMLPSIATNEQISISRIYVRCTSWHCDWFSILLALK